MHLQSLVFANEFSASRKTLDELIHLYLVDATVSL